MIRLASLTDKPFIESVYRENKAIFGNYGLTLSSYFKERAKNQFMLVWEGVGFCHYRIRKDGVKVIYEIAVTSSAKGQGAGKKFIEKVGFPLMLKTDQVNLESNAFYRKIGMIVVGTHTTKKGKLMNIYYKA